MCLRLLEAKTDDRVSLEVLDDIAVRRANGDCLVEQAKSGLTQNPVSDWSADLWKTFANWVRAITSGHLDVERTQFVLSVCPAYTGGWVQRLHEVRTRAQAEEVMAAVMAELKRRGAMPSGCTEHLQVVIDCDPSIRGKLFTSFALVACPNDPVDDIRQRLVALSPAVLDDTCRAAIGWVKDTTDQLIRAHQPAEVEASVFHTWLRAYVRKHDRDHLLVSFAPEPSAASIDREMRVRTYVRQLEAIDSPADEKLAAVGDYLLAASDRTIWSERGLILEDSLTEFKTELSRQWSVERRRTELLHAGRTEPERGRLLYLEAIAYRARLEGKEVPAHFAPGSMHELADGMEIGWHPRFETVVQPSREPVDA